MRIPRTIRHVFLREGFVCFLIGLSLLTSSSLSVTHVANAAASACIETTHCYGIARWYSGSPQAGSSSFAGAYTSITTVPLHINNNGIHVFTHEMWLDEDSPRCSINPNNRCWIEVGYGNMRSWYGGEFYTGMFYFWADTRPGAPALHVHILGPVKSSQFGSTQSYSIRRINRTTYEVRAGNYIDYSTGNTMIANTLTVGEELANDGGLAFTSARPAFFTHTAWLDYSGWHFFQTPGYVVSMNPDAARWINSSPTSGQTFYTACCYRA